MAERQTSLGFLSGILMEKKHELNNYNLVNLTFTGSLYQRRNKSEEVCWPYQA